ncbi:MAG: cellulose biosynthesis cyclic di-GMP-binding regulatory protein BcsB, partial [Chloroflexi bacterium]|nr:cellulose biosynthesis cyclic di-GMP-binding regulatory protein BcsB [Chloroflexota bacterium]
DLDVPPTVREGSFTVQDVNQTLAVIPLPQGRGRHTVGLDRSPVQQGKLYLQLRTLLEPQSTLCSPSAERWVVLRNLKVTFRGTAARPSSVAAFWPPDLQQLYILVDTTDLTPEVAETVLTVSAFAARLAPAHPVAVYVAPYRDESIRGGPFTRTVIVRPGTPLRLRLVAGPEGWPGLLIPVPEQEVRHTVRRWLEQALPLVWGPEARLKHTLPLTPEPTLRLPLTALHPGRLQMRGVGTLETQIRFRQSDFGQPVRQVRLYLQGMYTPVPPTGFATLMVLLNDGLVATQPLDRGGSFTLRVTFPKALLQRENTLTLRVLYTPPGGECRLGSHDIVVDIAENAFLEAEPGQSLPPGFERYPQALLPEFEVALDALDIQALDLASILVAALQRLSPVSLSPRVTAWRQARVHALPVLVIARDPEAVGEWDPPLTIQPFRLVDDQGREVLRLEQDVAFQILQAYELGDRDVLLWSQQGWDEQPQEALRQALLHRQDGWYALHGDTWVHPRGQEDFSLRLRPSALKVEPVGLEATLWDLWARVRGVVFGVAILAVVAFLIWAYPRLVQDRTPPDA